MVNLTARANTGLLSIEGERGKPMRIRKKGSNGHLTNEHKDYYRSPTILMASLSLSHFFSSLSILHFFFLIFFFLHSELSFFSLSLALCPVSGVFGRSASIVVHNLIASNHIVFTCAHLYALTSL